MSGFDKVCQPGIGIVHTWDSSNKCNACKRESFWYLNFFTVSFQFGKNLVSLYHHNSTIATIPKFRTSIYFFLIWRIDSDSLDSTILALFSNARMMFFSYTFKIWAMASPNWLQPLLLTIASRSALLYSSISSECTPSMASNWSWNPSTIYCYTRASVREIVAW